MNRIFKFNCTQLTEDDNVWWNLNLKTKIKLCGVVRNMYCYNYITGARVGRAHYTAAESVELALTASSYSS